MSAPEHKRDVAIDLAFVTGCLVGALVCGCVVTLCHVLPALVAA